MDKFSKSENYKSEYSCAVVKINELTPIEGSDFLAKTMVFGTQIVVRRDQISEGDLMLYAANETQLNERFLSVNNLYEIGERGKNANSEDVEAIMTEYAPIKEKADQIRYNIKNIKSAIESFNKNLKKHDKKLSKLRKELSEFTDEQVFGLEKDKADELNKKNNELNELTAKIEHIKQTIKNKQETVDQLTKEKDDLIASGKHIIDEAKKHCGFFNKYGRVKLIVLKGVPSFGFLFSPAELFKFDPSITLEDIENHVGEEFDTVNGELFVKAYVPPVKEPTQRNNTNKAQKKVKRFDRMVEGQFFFHYDTTQLQKAISTIKPDDVVDISVKLHGTSCIIGKLLVKQPIKLPLFKRCINKFIDFTGLFKSMRITDYNVEYGPVYTSRKVIKNQYIIQDVSDGYYDVDIWTAYGDIIYPYLTEGMTVYGEICGYVSGSEKMIQKNYDYGCKTGENVVMFYRITSDDENGKKREWELSEVYDWTIKLIERMKENNDENWRLIHPIDILYHGTLEDLYPNIDTETHWHDNVLEAMKNDTEHFGMEELEPLCKYYKSPREGIVLRIEGDLIRESFKLKCTKFLKAEGELMDVLTTSGDSADIEMIEAYS